MKSNRTFEGLEPRLALTSISFAPHEITTVDATVRSLATIDWDVDNNNTNVVFTTGTGPLETQLWIARRHLNKWDVKPLIEECKYYTPGCVGSSSLTAADLDGDGTPELLHGSGWLDRNGNVSSFAPIKREFGLGPVGAADFDGDGDMDLITGGSTIGVASGLVNGERQWIPNDRLGWHANDGNSQFTSPAIIQRVFRSIVVSSVQPVDFDGDGDVDIVETVIFKGPFSIPGIDDASSDATGAISLHLNDGTGEFQSAPLVPWSAGPGGARRTWSHAADFDSDGDVDLLYFHGESGSNLVTFVMLENDEGKYLERELDITGPFLSAVVEDLDADGMLDILAVTSDSVDLHASNGDGTFGDPQEIATGHFNRFTSPAIDDIDGDGDFDVLVSHSAITNEDGTIREPHKLVWYESDLEENESEQLVGDANRDGEVSFADFLVLSQNFGKEVDAVWGDGDFDGDGAVAFVDFLLLSENFGRQV